jgi:hypothetical protein
LSYKGRDFGGGDEEAKKKRKNRIDGKKAVCRQHTSGVGNPKGLAFYDGLYGVHRRARRIHN